MYMEYIKYIITIPVRLLYIYGPEWLETFSLRAGQATGHEFLWVRQGVLPEVAFVCWQGEKGIHLQSADRRVGTSQGGWSRRSQWLRRSGTC